MRFRSQIAKSIIFLSTTGIFLFFLVYFIFGDKQNYFQVTVFCNAFVMTLLYALGGFLLLYSIDKAADKLKFSDSFLSCFGALFVSGLVTLLVIVLFMGYINPEVELLLRNQRIEIFIENVKKADATSEKAKQILKMLEESKQVSLFSRPNLIKLSSVLVGYYTLISLFLSLFFRAKNTPSRV